MNAGTVAAIGAAITLVGGGAAHGASAKMARAVMTKDRELVFYYDSESHIGEGKRYEVPNGAKAMNNVGWWDAWDAYDRVVFTEAFENCPIEYNTANWFNYNLHITSIGLPRCAKVLGSGTFQQCTKLESVTLAATVKTIGAGAFLACPLLKSITFAGTKPPTFDARAISKVHEDCTIHLPLGANRSEWEAALGENLPQVKLDIPEPPKPGLVISIR